MQSYRYIMWTTRPWMLILVLEDQVLVLVGQVLVLILVLVV